MLKSIKKAYPREYTNIYPITPAENILQNNLMQQIYIIDPIEFCFRRHFKASILQIRFYRIDLMEKILQNRSHRKNILWKQFSKKISHRKKSYRLDLIQYILQNRSYEICRIRQILYNRYYTIDLIKQILQNLFYRTDLTKYILHRRSYRRPRIE